MFLKHRDLIHETVSEFGRRGNFVRIYPAQGSKIYDKFFTSCKPLNKIIYKTLFSNEIIDYKSSRDDELISINQNMRQKMSHTITEPDRPRLE